MICTRDVKNAHCMCTLASKAQLIARKAVEIGRVAMMLTSVMSKQRLSATPLAVGAHRLQITQKKDIQTEKERAGGGNRKHPSNSNGGLEIWPKITATARYRWHFRITSKKVMEGRQSFAFDGQVPYLPNSLE